MVLRKRLRGNVVAEIRDADGQSRLSFAEIEDDEPIWEHAVLVTSLDLETIGDDPDDGIRTISHSSTAIAPIAKMCSTN